MRQITISWLIILTLTSTVRAETMSDRFDRGLADSLDWVGDLIPDNTDAALIGTALGMGGIIGGNLASGWAAAAVGAAAATGWAPVLAGVAGVAAGAGLGLALVAGGTAVYNWARGRDFDGSRVDPVAARTEEAAPAVALASVHHGQTM